MKKTLSEGADVVGMQRVRFAYRYQVVDFNPIPLSDIIALFASEKFRFLLEEFKFSVILIDFNVYFDCL